MSLGLRYGQAMLCWWRWHMGRLLSRESRRSEPWPAMKLVEIECEENGYEKSHTEAAPHEAGMAC